MVHPTQHHFVEGDYPDASAQNIPKLEPLDNGGTTGMYYSSCLLFLIVCVLHSLEVFIKSQFSWGSRP